MSGDGQDRAPVADCRSGHVITARSEGAAREQTPHEPRNGSLGSTTELEIGGGVLAWLRVESNFPSHKKVHAAGDMLGRAGKGRVLAVWVLGSAYAVGHLTDGFVPFSVLDDTRYDRKPQEVIDAMLAYGLLHPTEGGYTIHDFHDYNPSAEEWKERHEKKVTAGRLGGEKSVEAKRQARAKHVLGGNGASASDLSQANVKPDSESDPDTDPEPPIKTKRDTRFEAFWERYPKKVGKGDAEKAFARHKPDDRLMHEISRALAWQVGQPGWLKDGGKFIPNPATWLNQRRWEDEPFEPPADALIVGDSNTREGRIVAAGQRTIEAIRRGEI